MFLRRGNQTQRRSLLWESFALSESIIFISCETRLVNSPLYVDTAPCIIAKSGHSFVNIGSLKASDLRDSCRIELMVLTSSWINGTNSSYIDIHNGLLYGFELSWLHSYYRRGNWCLQPLDCYVDNDTNKVKCFDIIPSRPVLLYLRGVREYADLIAVLILAAGALSPF